MFVAKISLSIWRKVIIICPRALRCLAFLSNIPGDIKLINISDYRIYIFKDIVKLELEVKNECALFHLRSILLFPSNVPTEVEHHEQIIPDFPWSLIFYHQHSDKTANIHILLSYLE